MKKVIADLEAFSLRFENLLAEGAAGAAAASRAPAAPTEDVERVGLGRIRWSTRAQRVRVRRRAPRSGAREETVEQDEMESGELNLIPYLDMVTNLMLFLLASVSAGLILVADRHDAARQGAAVADQVTQPQHQPRRSAAQAVRLDQARRDDPVVGRAASRARSTQPKATFKRTGKDGEAAMARTCARATRATPRRSAACRARRRRRSRSTTTARSTSSCSRSPPAATPASSARPTPTRSSCRPTARSRTRTIVSTMAAMRCMLPDFGKEVDRVCPAHRGREPQEGQGADLAGRQAATTPTRAQLRSEEDGAVPRHPVLVGVRVSFTQREARRIIRKAVGRVPEGEEIRHLNIMPMMDMMTILLVAFIFQAATSATALTAGTVVAAAVAVRRRAARGRVDADHHEDRHRRRGQVDRLGRQRRRRRRRERGRHARASRSRG